MSESIESPLADSNRGRLSRLTAWAGLVRFPNVFTVIADVGAAFLLVAGGPQPVSRFAAIVLSGISLYWAGMILNDVFDVERDRAERPERPIPAGDIELRSAQRAGWVLLSIGVTVALLAGYLPSGDHPTTWLPGAVAMALAVLIVAYDGPLKRTPLAPAAMGGCRVLSFLLGASACLDTGGGAIFPRYLVGIALGFGIYITGITTMARNEATGGRASTLNAGLLLTIIGAICLAFAPQLERQPMGWRVSTVQTFPIMIGLIALPVIMRGIRAAGDPTPAKIQLAIRVGIMTIIPFAASFALLGAGPIWGLLIFALIIPSLALAIRMRVT